MSDRKLLERDNERLAAALARLVERMGPCDVRPCDLGPGQPTQQAWWCRTHRSGLPCPVEEARQLLGGRGRGC